MAECPEMQGLWGHGLSVFKGGKPQADRDVLLTLLEGQFLTVCLAESLQVGRALIPNHPAG